MYKPGKTYLLDHREIVIPYYNRDGPGSVERIWLGSVFDGRTLNEKRRDMADVIRIYEALAAEGMKGVEDDNR